MTADAFEPLAPVSRTPASILSALTGADRDDFEADYAAALDNARDTYELLVLGATIERWWRYVNVTAGQPEARRAITRIAEQVTDGSFDAGDLEPVDFAALRG